MAFSNVEKNYPTDSGSRTLLTIVGDYAVLDGEFKISQSIEIDCELKGKLAVDGKITIQQNGFVSADVKTEEAEIIGRYVGDMEAAGNVVIRETGIAMGNIKTDSLVINKGGIFNGNITRITETKILLDERPAASTKIEKPAFQAEEQEKDSYSVSDFRDEDSQSNSYDVNVTDDNNPAL
jgi:cytoskeletal protein CcmA (bactofilin family)